MRESPETLESRLRYAKNENRKKCTIIKISHKSCRHGWKDETITGPSTENRAMRTEERSI